MQQSALPPLPGMLVRALPTIVRSGKIADDLTAIEAQFSLDAIRPAHLADYKSQFPGLVSAYPLTYFYLLAQRAHLAAMLDKRFPWPILGMVHVANRMEWLGTLKPEQGFVINVRIELPARASTRKRVRPVYIVDFTQNGHTILRCESTYQVGTGGKTPANRRVRAESLDLSLWQQLDIWQLNASLGRRYARLSGDYNPIHIHPWLSRWFGFNLPIIHGMYSVARMQADLEKQFQSQVTSMDVTFKRPLELPNTAVSHIQKDSGRLMVSDGQGAKTFLEGTFHL
ncbi:acyl dehydratase [Aliidiomarina sedimenti]|uniref:Acyl dehydratase n=1 Tax=Aliidiomarina sedimenti TaxID=1933879 RepID=A0ABY0C2W2_9GAMM|nr:MaoC/PaaZ C-terminal domain-containing protein [Aliidiomarina sedimenti]RUO31780.1 acyl dehydratase [Aliidiomarina sedimenti]